VLFFQLEFPGDFPFEIVDNPGERTFQLKRQFKDEIITRTRTRMTMNLASFL